MYIALRVSLRVHEHPHASVRTVRPRPHAGISYIRRLEPNAIINPRHLDYRWVDTFAVADVFAVASVSASACVRKRPHASICPYRSATASVYPSSRRLLRHDLDSDLDCLGDDAAFHRNSSISIV